MQYLCHTVQSGDSLQSIAAAYGIQANNLVAANPQIFTQPVICPGTTLAIPQPSIVPPKYYPQTPTTTTPNYQTATTTTPNYQTTTTPTPTDQTTTATPTYQTGQQTDQQACLQNCQQLCQQTYPQTGQQTNQTTEQQTTPTADTTTLNLEDQVVQLVNNERVSRGLNPLTLNPTLADIARLKSEDMVNYNYFSHYSPTYGSPFDMLRRFGVTYSSAGENIASGQTTAQSVMNTWMNSPGHAANILNDDYSEIGVGYAYNNGRPIWTQIFIRP